MEWDFSTSKKCFLTASGKVPFIVLMLEFSSIFWSKVFAAQYQQESHLMLLHQQSSLFGLTPQTKPQLEPFLIVFTGGQQSCREAHIQTQMCPKPVSAQPGTVVCSTCCSSGSACHAADFSQAC